MTAFVSHPSVRIKGTENNYEPANCTDPKCTKSWPHLHCPFCVKSEFFQDPVILKAHYRVKHVDKGIEFAGLKILRCCEQCAIVGTIKGTKEFKGAHWHCYKCRNGFTRRDEAVKHYRTHFRNPSTTFQIQVAQDITQQNQDSVTREVSTAVDSLPQEMTLIETVVTTGSMDDSLEESQTSVLEEQPTTEEVEKPSSGEIQVSVAANETVGTCEGQNIMIVPSGEVVRSIELDSKQDLEAILKQYKTVIKPPSNNNSNSTPHSTSTHWRREKSSLEQQVKELKAEVARLQTERTHMEHHLNAMKKELEVSAAEVAGCQKREAELLNQLKIPLDDRVSTLLGEMKAQHEELLHQQLAQLRQAYLQQQFGGTTDEFDVIHKSSPSPQNGEIDHHVTMATLVHEPSAQHMSEIMASVEGSRSEVVLGPEVYRSLPTAANTIGTDGIVLTSPSLMTEGGHPTQLFVVPHEASLQQVKSEVLEHQSQESDDLPSHEFHETEAESPSRLDYDTNQDVIVSTDHGHVDMEQKIILLESAVDSVESQVEYSQQKSDIHITLEQEDLEQTSELSDSGGAPPLNLNVQTNKRKLSEDDADGDGDGEARFTITYDTRKTKQSKQL